MVSLLLISSNPQQQQQIARVLSFTVFFPLQFYVSQSTRVKNIFSENKKLKQELAGQSMEIAQLRQQALESSRLEDLLSLSNMLNYELAAARVVAVEPSAIFRSAVISVGTDKKIQTYMPVITGNGIVGKVIQVMHNHALVQLLTDPSSRTSVLSQRSRETGILQTDNGREFFVLYRIHSDVVAGDTIVTSGLGGVYPKGLSVGIVSHVEESHDQLFKRVFITVGVNFNRLEEVFVVRLMPQWTSFRETLDSLGMGTPQ
jgi:rod shape-determining protein MreC